MLIPKMKGMGRSIAVEKTDGVYADVYVYVPSGRFLKFILSASIYVLLEYVNREILQRHFLKFRQDFNP